MHLGVALQPHCRFHSQVHQGKGDTGIAGTGLGYLPEPGGGSSGSSDDSGGGESSGGSDDKPDEIVLKALKCFNEKEIYSSCEESYRLTASGQLHVPPEYADEYCHGPCLQETYLVLKCVDDILSHFVFYNHATIEDVKETLKIGCTDGPHKGDFDVAEHIDKDKSNSSKLSYAIILLVLPSFILYLVLF